MTEKEIITKLLECFWLSEDGLEWSFREGHTVKDEDPKLNEALLQFIKDNGIRM